MSDPLRQALQGIWSSAAPAWERHADFVDDRGAEVAQAMLEPAGSLADAERLRKSTGGSCSSNRRPPAFPDQGI